MRLLQLASLLVEDVTRKVRRMVIAGGIVVVCALVVAIEGITAARLALEPAVGRVWAHLVIAGAFLLIGGASVMALSWTGRRAARAKAAREAQGEDPRAAIIAEAISLGYSLGRDFMKASPADQPAATEAADEIAARDARAAGNDAAADDRRSAA